MSDAPKVKFLTVVWGDQYIEEFARVSLPSFLAPGNLPALAETTDLEVLIMTSKKSLDAFHKVPIFNTLLALCPVRFIFIDDLITTGIYGVTLTLAYARGIIDSGAEQTNSYFVFMNSDFVLADGSLRTLARKIAEGSPCIMAPSLRVRSESALPLLVDCVDSETKRLVMPARHMVQLALDNLHPTVIGKTITQNLVNCTTHNQIYWQVDSTTLLARHHLIFMLAIKPERPISYVNSYCDYGFVPEMIPSGKFEILDDSDDFFMLESQSTEQEKSFLYCGSASAEKIARELSSWTTREHRRFAEVDVVFHSRDLPDNLDVVRQQAIAYMSNLSQKMTSSPLSHVAHFYWYFGIQSWLRLKAAENNRAVLFPHELQISDKLLAKSVTALSHGPWLKRKYFETLSFIRRLVDAKPNVPIWHHAWLDTRLALSWIDLIKQRPNHRNLLVCDTANPLSNAFQQVTSFDFVPWSSLTLFDEKEWASWWNKNYGGNRYGNIFVNVCRSDIGYLQKALKRLDIILDADVLIGIYVNDRKEEVEEENFSNELAQHVLDIFPAGWLGLRLEAWFAGGIAKRRLRLMEKRLRTRVWPLTWKRLLFLPLVAMSWLAIEALTVLNNIRSRRFTQACPSYCSSAMLLLERQVLSEGKANKSKEEDGIGEVDELGSAKNYGVRIVNGKFYAQLFARMPNRRENPC